MVRQNIYGRSDPDGVIHFWIQFSVKSREKESYNIPHLSSLSSTKEKIKNKERKEKRQDKNLYVGINRIC